MLNSIYIRYKRNKNNNLKLVIQKMTGELHPLTSHTDQLNTDRRCYLDQHIFNDPQHLKHSLILKFEQFIFL